MRTRTLTFTLSGSSELVGSALKRLNAAPRIARLTACDEGEVAIDILGEGLQTRQNTPIEFEMEDSDEPTTSVVIRLPNVTPPTYFVIEDENMVANEEGAAALIKALHLGAFNEKDGFVLSTDQYEVFAPTPATVQDRFVLRDAQGRKIAEITLPGENGTDRFTAAVTFEGESMHSPALIMGAQGDSTLYRISPRDLMKACEGNETVELSKDKGIELPGAIRRVRRADKRGFAAVELQDDQVLFIRSTGQGGSAIVQEKEPMAADADTVQNGWEGFGFSNAVKDPGGKPSRGYVKPSENGVSLRFVPQERRAEQPGGGAK